MYCTTIVINNYINIKITALRNNLNVILGEVLFIIGFVHKRV
jgi:hypothetical protein